MQIRIVLVQRRKDSLSSPLVCTKSDIDKLEPYISALKHLILTTNLIPGGSWNSSFSFCRFYSDIALFGSKLEPTHFQALKNGFIHCWNIYHMYVIYFHNRWQHKQHLHFHGRRRIVCHNIRRKNILIREEKATRKRALNTTTTTEPHTFFLISRFFLQRETFFLRKFSFWY